MSVIETKNLTKYYGKSRGIENVNLSVNEGEIFGFIGPNGAGKSTTIRTLLKLIYPTGGEAKIFGMDIIKDSKKIKRQIGFMPSEVNYYDKMDAYELLEYSANFYGVKSVSKRIKQLADMFNLNLKKKIEDLSLGNKKKVSIIQSVLHKPKLLILDEPTSGLDPLMQAKFFDLLREENQHGSTIFFSSHILTEVQKLCKRVAIIKEGEIIKVEDIETLRKRQLKKISIDFFQKVEKSNFEVDGVYELEVRDNSVYFLFSGMINKLLRKIVDKEIKNLLIEEPTLEEIFMHYYTDDKEDK
jgi:ABC-2 type transport system ATP-binding protein